MVAAICPAMEQYAIVVVENCVDGSTLLSFTSKDEASEFLDELGVDNKVHKRVLLGKVLEFIEASSSSSAAKPAAGGGGASRAATVAGGRRTASSRTTGPTATTPKSRQ